MNPTLDPDERPAPEQLEALLRARASLLARRRDPGEAATEAEELLVVRAGALRCAIDLGEIDRVVAIAELTPLPNAPPLAAGLVYVEGQILTVIDLARALGSRSTGIRAIVRAGHGAESLALGIDGYLGVERLAPSAFAAPPAPLQGPAARYLRGATSDGIARLELRSLLGDLLSQESPDPDERTE